MGILTLIKANIKKRKMSFIGVFILILIISIFLTSIITIVINSKSSISEQVENVGYGDMVNWLIGVDDIDELERGVKAVDDVSSVESIPCIYPSKGVYAGEESNTTAVLISYDLSNHPYQIFDVDGYSINTSPEELQENEVYVPIAYKSLYNAEVGDKIEVTIDDRMFEYEIKGFFEDPFAGSNVMGLKYILMNDDEFNTIFNTVTDTSSGYAMNIYQNENSDLSYMEFETELNKETNLASYSFFSLGKTQSFAYMTILVNIFSGALVAFVILLLIVALIVLSHSIGSSIELDYKDMGILKAVGFTKEKLRIAIILQYFIAVLAGIIIGTPLAALVINFVNKMTINVTGVIIPSDIAILPCFAAFLLVILFITGFIFLKTIKIGAISPLNAIRGGRKDVYFANRLRVPIFKHGMRFWLAMRQLVSNLKQHISALVVSAIMVFFLVLVSNIGSWVGTDGEGVKTMFVPYSADFTINYIDDSIKQEAEDFIESYSKIDNQFGTAEEYLLLNDNNCQCMSLSDAEMFNTILSGRTCLYENEILITQFVADDLDIGIGDTVSVSNGNNTKDFVVSGIYQCAMDTGTNFALSFNGYKYLTGESPEENFVYDLEDSSQTDIIVEKLNEKFSGQLEINTNEEAGADSIITAIEAVSLLMYVIAIVFVLIVIILMCDKIFAKEQHDIGVYKAIGLTSTQLRLQFSSRFTIMALIGGIVGIVLNFFFTNSVMEALLSLAGISKFEAEFTFASMVTPVIFISLVFLVFGYIATRKVKRVEIKDLIVE